MRYGASITIALVAAMATMAIGASPPEYGSGRALFKIRCAGCHTGTADAAGPPLRSVWGRRIASVPGIAYSAALSARAGQWDAETLDAFLASPSRFAPGGAMPIGVANAGNRAAVVAYLKGGGS